MNLHQYAETHEVTNQVPPLLGFNTAETPMIDDALRRAHVDAPQLDAIHALGALAGTAEALEGGWFHTGDGGVLGDDGYLTIMDRKKDVIITGGENVSSIEVEDVLFSHPDVTEVAVIGIPDDKWGETIKALVVVAEGSEATEADLIAWCKSKAAGYKAPTTIEFRDELARTATGKLQKFKLRLWTTDGSATVVTGLKTAVGETVTAGSVIAEIKDAE